MSLTIDYCVRNVVRGPYRGSRMTRRGSLQRSLITVLALLMVTPQVLLRPCCCSRQRTATAASSKAEADFASLPPCCQKRLQAAQKNATHSSYGERSTSLTGVHDSSRCGCRIKTEVARNTRAVFKALSDRQLETRVADQLVSSIRQSVLDAVLLTTAYWTPPDWGAGHPERLCRWLV